MAVLVHLLDSYVTRLNRLGAAMLKVFSLAIKATVVNFKLGHEIRQTDRLRFLSYFFRYQLSTLTRACKPN